MAYLGREPLGGEVILMNSIESQFNGSLTTFNLTRTLSGVTSAFYPVGSQQLLVSLGGVIQRPDPTGDTGFRISFNTIIFAVAPPTGTSCFIVSYGNVTDIGAPANNTVTTDKLVDGSVTPAKLSTGGPTWNSSGTLTVSGDLNVVGSFNSGTQGLFWGDNEVANFGNDNDLKIYHNGINNYFDSITVGQKVFFRTSSSTTLDTNALSILSNGNVGIGTNNPGTKLDVRISTTAFVNGTVLNSYPISKYINSSSDGADRGLEIGAPTGSVSSPVYLKVSGTGNRFAILNQSDSEQLTILTSGNVGIGTTNPGFKLEVNGSFAATTKSFLIEHPTKKNYKLRHGSLEGPENGVYVRGRTSTNIIELPEYWTGLVDADSITVNLTPIGNCHIWVEEINNNKVYINSEDTIDCFYTILAERKDVEKLIVEIEEN